MNSEVSKYIDKEQLVKQFQYPCLKILTRKASLESTKSHLNKLKAALSEIPAPAKPEDSFMHHLPEFESYQEFM